MGAFQRDGKNKKRVNKIGICIPGGKSNFDVAAVEIQNHAVAEIEGHAVAEAPTGVARRSCTVLYIS